MPQIPIAGAMVSSESDDQGEIFRFFPGGADSFSVSGFVEPTTLAIHLAGPRNELTTLAVQTAPTVTSAAISGSTAATGTLTLNVVAEGNPLPSVTGVQWRKNGAAIPGATTMSWVKTGLAPGDIISATGTVSNGVGDPVPFSASNPVTIAAPGVELVRQLESVGLTVGDADLVVNYPYNEQTGTGHFRHAASYQRAPATAPAGFTYTATGHVISAAAVMGPTSITVKGIGANGTEVSSTATYSVAAPVSTGPSVVGYNPDGTAYMDLEPGTNATLVIDPPHVHAGTYTITTAMMTDLATGPVCLVPPVIAIDTELTTYSVTKIGLWINDQSKGPMIVTRSWRRAGANITPAQIGMTLAIQPTYRGAAITNVETATQGTLTRTQASNAITISAAAAAPDTFASSSDMPLTDFVGASGEAWTKIYDDTDQSRTNSEMFVSTEWLYGGSANGDVYIRGAADRGPKQFAQADFLSGGTNNRAGHAICVCMIGTTGYGLVHFTADSAATPPSPGKLSLRRYGDPNRADVNTTLAEWTVDIPKSVIRNHRLEVDRTSGQPVLSVYFEGALVGTHTDTSASALSGGGVGVRAATNVGNGNPTTTTGRLKTFNGGSL